MRGLLPRILVLLLAASAVSATVSFVGFAFWGQKVAEEARVFEMHALASAIRPHLGEDSERLQDILGATARSQPETRLAVVGRDGRRLDSGVFEWPADLPEPGQVGLVQGQLVLVVDVAADSTPWEQMVLARPATLMFDRVFESTFTVFAFLGFGAALAVASGILLARRSLIAPLERLSKLVTESDHAGLKSFGGHSDTFASLGRNILAMNDRIRRDSAQIEQQLAALRAANSELANTQSQLVRAERLAVVGTLSAGLAHEVGNPLAVVTGFVELLRDNALEGVEREQAVLRIETELHRIQGIVRDLLDFSRASTDVDGTCSIIEVLDEVRALLSPQKPFAHIQLDIEAHDSLVPIDKNALVQVVLNLALNAADAIDGQGIVRIRSDGHNPVRIDVEDSGPGVDSKYETRIFEPFFTTKEAGRGTGLGLSVCERIVTTAGGSIRLERSSELGGACFVVSIPEKITADLPVLA